MSVKSIYTRETRIRLMDGNEYVFRALPFNRRNVELLKRIRSGDGDAAVDALLEAVETSLSFDYSPDQVSQIFDAGLIPMITNEEAEERIREQIIGALANQMARTR